MKTTLRRPLLRVGTARVGTATLLACGGILAGASAASAHVTMTPSSTAAGAYVILTFSVPHGCEGSPTTEVAIQMPEQINAVTPTRTADWTVEKSMQQLDEPITDSHGNEITERVGQVVYTATTPLPDGYRDAFELSVQLPDAPGETLVFPTVQTCEKGETAWVEVPAEGQSEDDLEAPAPTVTITDPSEEGAHGAAAPAGDDQAGGSSDATATDEDQASADTGDGAPAWVGWTALALGAVGAVAGGAALVRSRRS